MRPNSIKPSKPDTRELFERADRMWNSGKLRNAFNLFLQAAKAGDRDSQLNTGYFYDKGIGVKRDLRKALRWYLTAYRRGDASAANNIGTIWRDRKEHRKALWWFKRAVKLGNEASNFAIAIHFLKLKSKVVFFDNCIEEHQSINALAKVI